jgi:hypothetical protein
LQIENLLTGPFLGIVEVANRPKAKEAVRSEIEAYRACWLMVVLSQVMLELELRRSILKVAIGKRTTTVVNVRSGERDEQT